MEKRKRDEKKERVRKNRNRKKIPGSQMCCPPFLLEPWQSRIGHLPPLCSATCKNS
jgi:hypothetical protein